MIRSADPQLDDILDEIAALLGVDRPELPPRLDKHQVATVFDVEASTTDTWACTGRYPELTYYKAGRTR